MGFDRPRDGDRVRDDVRHRLGRFELDRSTRSLRLGAEEIPLQPRIFDLLSYLVRNPDRALSREELFAEVWSDVVVSDAALTKAARVLRSILRRDPLTRDVLETVRGHGYRLRASVGALGTAPETSRRSERPRPPFVGRDGELARLVECVDDVRRRGRRFVLVVGDPGAGKSALVQRLLETAASDLLVGEGQCIEGFGEQSPYLPVLEAITGFARFDSGSRRFRIRSIVQRAAPRWRAYLPSLFPDVPHDDALFELQPSEMARQVLDAIELIGAEEPAILFLEDLQWADQSTLKLLHSLVARGGALPLLTICTARASELERSESLRALRNAVARSAAGLVVETPPVSRDALQAYAAWTLRRDVIESGASTDRFVDWLHARTAGHPLFFTQLIEYLASIGLLAPSQGPDFSTRILDAAGIPATLAQLIQQWRGDLSALDREFLEVASVVGTHFDLRVVESVLGADSSGVDACCERLCDAGWLADQTIAHTGDGSRGARLRFAHVLFREALYAQVPIRRREQLHHEVARRLEADRPGDANLSSALAAHFELAGRLAEAARQRIRAAAFAASTQSVEETLFHADAGLALLRSLPEAERTAAEFGLRMSIAMAAASRSGFGEPRAMDGFEQARSLASAIGDPDREVAATWGVASCLKMRGESEAAREAGYRLLSLAESVDEPRFLALALDLLCSIAFFQGQFAECLALKRRMDGVSGSETRDGDWTRSIEDVVVTTQLYGALASWHLGDVATATNWVRDAGVRAERLRHPYTTVFCEVFTSILHSLLGDSAAQRRHAARGHAVAEESGLTFLGAVALFMALAADPPSDETLSALRASLAEMARFGGLGGTYFIRMLADHERAAGHVEAARRLCQSGIDLAERTAERHHLPILLVTRAGLAIDASERERGLSQAEEVARRIGSVALQAQVARARDAQAARGR